MAAFPSFPHSITKTAYRRNAVRLLAIASILATCVCEYEFEFGVTKVPRDAMNTSGLSKAIAATGETVLLGDSSAVIPDERPAMRVEFNHDYDIDSTEITIGLYDSIMRTLPPEYADQSPAPKKPVCYVSWFDAILFCNRRSVAEGLDTVYSYTAIEGNLGGGVYRLGGLSVNWRADGYRLPTEAEWVYAARAGGGSRYPWPETDSSSAGDYAWYAANAGDSAHAVATRSGNGLGIYDMAGNAAEWVFDVKTSYSDTTITEFLGAPLGSTQDRIVKGGGFVNDETYLRIDNRGDTYPVTASTRGPHVGFRCVRGPIEGGAYLRDSSTVIAVEPVEVLLQDISSVTGTNRGKVAFVNMVDAKRYLTVLDYSSGTPVVLEWTDVDDVHMPMLSPDGRWVAYATKGAGIVTGSTIRVRALAAESDSDTLEPDAFAPRFWVSSTGADTFVVYTSSTVSNVTAEWPRSATYRVRFSGGSFVGTPERITGAGSYYGGLSADARYCASGFTRLVVRDLTKDSNRVLFTGPANGKGEGDTSQVCNVSISPDTGAATRVLFLDFGSFPARSTLTNTTYGVHGYLFVSDLENRVLRWYQVPDGYSGWTHPEWSNRGAYAVSNVSLESGKNPRVYLIDLEDSTYTPVVAGMNLVDPSLWLEPIHEPGPDDMSRHYDLDSLGWYNEPPVEKFQDGLAAKFPFFWRALDSVNIMFVGNSRLQAGIDPSLISLPSYNFGHGGGGHMEVRRIVFGYILAHANNIRAVAISLSVDWFGGPHVEDVGSRSWFAGTENTLGYNYDKDHDFWPGEITDTFLTLIDQAPNPELSENVLENGWHPNPTKAVGGVFGLAACTTWTPSDDSCMVTLDSLRLMGDTLAARGIHLLIVNFPQTSGYRDPGRAWTHGRQYGRYGPSWSTAHGLIDSVEAIADRSEYVHFYDAYRFGYHDYRDAVHFRDVDHLSAVGARKLSPRVDSVLTDILN